MQRVIFLLSFFLAGSAVAASETISDAPPRAYLWAKRVASMENSKDLPSRAVWLSNRVIHNSRALAFERTKGTKPSPKRPPASKN